MKNLRADWKSKMADNWAAKGQPSASLIMAQEK
jgi:hypothetical protein